MMRLYSDDEIIETFARRRNTLQQIVDSISIKLPDNIKVFEAYKKLADRESKARKAFDLQFKNNAVPSAEWILGYGFAQAPPTGMQRSQWVNSLLELNGFNRLYPRSPGEALLIYTYDTECSCNWWNDMRLKYDDFFTGMFGTNTDNHSDIKKDTKETLKNLLQEKAANKRGYVITYKSLCQYIETHFEVVETNEGEKQLVTGALKTEIARSTLNDIIQKTILEADGQQDKEIGYSTFLEECKPLFGDYRIRANNYLLKVILEIIELQINEFMAAQTKYTKNEITKDTLRRVGAGIKLTGNVMVPQKSGDYEPVSFSIYLKDHYNPSQPVDIEFFSNFEVKPASIYNAFSKFYCQYPDIDPKYIRLINLFDEHVDGYYEYPYIALDELQRLCRERKVKISGSEDKLSLIARLIRIKLRHRLGREYNKMELEQVQALCSLSGIPVSGDEEKLTLIKNIIAKEIKIEEVKKAVQYSIMLDEGEEDSIETGAYSHPKYGKMNKKDLQTLCAKRNILYEESDTNRVLIGRHNDYDYYYDSNADTEELRELCNNRSLHPALVDDRSFLSLQPALVDDRSFLNLHPALVDDRSFLCGKLSNLDNTRADDEKIKSYDVSNNTAQRRFSSLLFGERDISREFLTLFLIFAGKQSDYIDHVLRQSGYLPIEPHETRPFDMLIHAAFQPSNRDNKGRFISSFVTQGAESILYKRAHDDEHLARRSAAKKEKAKTAVNSATEIGE